MPATLATDVRAAKALGVAAVVLVVALAAWTALVAGGGDGRSAPVLILLAALAAAGALGSLLAPRTDLIPGAVAATIAGAFVLTYPGLLGAGGAPTGYANSNATLAAVGVVAAIAAARRAPSGRPQRAWLGVAAALAVTALLTRSTAGIAVLVAVATLWWVAERIRWPALVAAGGAVTVSLALAVTGAMAVDPSLPTADADAVRVDLWSAAVDLAAEEPVRGLGPGAFEERNPLTDDDDLRWVHHEYLELLVEIGGVGLLLVIGLGIVVFARLALLGGSGGAPAAALTIVALHGTVDHVWHTPAVLVAVALLVGDGLATEGARQNKQPPSVAEEADEWVRRAIAGDGTEA